MCGCVHSCRAFHARCPCSISWAQYEVPFACHGMGNGENISRNSNWPRQMCLFCRCEMWAYWRFSTVFEASHRTDFTLEVFRIRQRCCVAMSILTWPSKQGGMNNMGAGYFFVTLTMVARFLWNFLVKVWPQLWLGCLLWHMYSNSARMALRGYSFSVLSSIWPTLNSIRYVASLWALQTPHTFLDIGSAWKWFHLANNYESERFSPQK